MGRTENNRFVPQSNLSDAPLMGKLPQMYCNIDRIHDGVVTAHAARLV